jgi:4-carboxymuconolactone decarboxylase
MVKVRPLRQLMIPLDEKVIALIRLSATIAAGSEEMVRAACSTCVERDVPTGWVEEAILQSYLFAGFPRTLNATREWRRISGVAAPAAEELPAPDLARWRQQGEATCAIVYGKYYDKLRHNIHQLHPALDEWMVVEGYGKILSRPGLELRLRELCIVASCVAAGQDRQLHSHLHGALNTESTPAEVSAALDALAGVVPAEHLDRARLLLARVVGK